MALRYRKSDTASTGCKWGGVGKRRISLVHTRLPSPPIHQAICVWFEFDMHDSKLTTHKIVRSSEGRSTLQSLICYYVPALLQLNRRIVGHDESMISG